MDVDLRIMVQVVSSLVLQARCSLTMFLARDGKRKTVHSQLDCECFGHNAVAS